MSAVSLPTRFAIRARRAAARAVQTLELGLDVATLALLSDAQLEALTASFYDESPTYTADGHNQQGLFDWERAVVEQHFPAGGKILVTSAGGGREALALVADGYEVVATECVDSLYQSLERNLAIAASRGAARAVHAPPDDVPVAHALFDAAVLGWSAYTHISGEKRRVSFLRRLLKTLRPGAPALVSYWGRRDVDARGGGATAGLANLIRRPLGRRLIEVGETTRDGHHQRSCFIGEVPVEAREAGFEVVEENWDGCPHVVLRAPAAPAAS